MMILRDLIVHITKIRLIYRDLARLIVKKTLKSDIDII